jgi:hypothetical protein
MTSPDNQLEVLGLISTQYASEIHAAKSSVIDKSYLAALAYYDLGIRKFLFRGFDPIEDAIDYGRRLLPLLREATAARRAPAQTASELRS